MSSFAGALVRRGVQHFDTIRKSGGGTHYRISYSSHGTAVPAPVHHVNHVSAWEGKMPPPPEGSEPMSPAMMATLTVTLLIFAGIFMMTTYTYGHLIPTLAMVETPSAVLVESVVTDTVDLEDSPKNPMLPAQHREAAIIEQAPITTSLRSTKQHLRTVGGFLGRFRGFSMYIIYSMLIAHFYEAFHYIMPRIVAYPAVAVLFAIPRMTWTHIIISSPTTRPWFRRFPSVADALKGMRKIALPTTAVALSEIAATIAFIALCPEELKNPEKMDKSEMDCAAMRALVFQTILAGLVALGVTLFATIPTTAVLAKIQTSLLHEDEDTILVVDRSEDMDFRSAWKSFDWNARARVYKAYGKFVAIQTAYVLLMSVVVYAQFVAFLGWNWEEKFPQTMYATMYRHGAFRN